MNWLLFIKELKRAYKQFIFSFVKLPLMLVGIVVGFIWEFFIELPFAIITYWDKPKAKIKKKKPELACKSIKTASPGEMV